MKPDTNLNPQVGLKMIRNDKYMGKYNVISLLKIINLFKAINSNIVCVCMCVKQYKGGSDKMY